VSASLPESGSGARAKKRPVPEPGSRTRPPLKPVRRVVRVLRRPLETREVLAGDELLELEAEILPRWRKTFAGAAKKLVGKIRCAEASESHQPLLLVGARAVPRGLYGDHEPDRGEIVFGSTFPAFGETAVAGEAIVLRRNRWFCGNGRVEDLGLPRLAVHLRRGRGFRSRESAVEAEASTKDRGVEKGQGELIVVHGEVLVKGACEREPGA
jgi:hypothetical protein